MKKFVFAMFALCLVNAAFAQAVLSGNYKNSRPKADNAFVKSLKQSRINQFGSRATQTFDLDYDAADNQYADNLGFDYLRFVNNINRRYTAGPPSDTSGNFTCKWAVVRFDTLYDYVEELSYPLAGSTITVDTVHFLFNHFNNTGNTDTLTVSVIQLANTPSGLLSSNQGVSLSNVVLWDTVIITNQSLTPTLTPLQLAVASFPVGITLPTGTGYGVYVQFAGDTANKFSLADGNRDECGGDCAAAEAFIPENSWRYLNLYLPGGAGQLSGVGGLVLNCDATNPAGTPESCELFYFQNWGIWSTVTVDIPLSVSVAQSNLAGCPGASVPLSATAVGGTGPYTYSWSNGQSGATIQVSVGTTVETYTVTATDANNDTETATVTVTPQGITIALGADQSVACGQTVNLSPTVSGNVQGATYAWNYNNATTLNLTNVPAGSYSITATNSSGCSATDNVVISLTGVGQNLDFTLPPSLIRNCPFYVENQSSDLTNWDFSWDFGDGELAFEPSNCHAWASLGSFTVTLTADSGNCQLVLTDAVNVVNGTCSNPSPECPVGIDEALLSSINIYPNPTTGKFVVTMDAVSGKNAVINVVNIRGEVIATEKFIATGNDSKEINLSNMANGLYLINIQVDGKLASKTVLKN